MKDVICTSVCIMDRENKILLGKRTGTDYCCDMWGFPGGKLHPGETMEECAKREVYEEVGLLCNRLILWTIDCNFHQNGDRYLSGIYLTRFPIGDVTNKEPHKCLDLSWFCWPTELPKDLVPQIQNMIKNGLDPRSTYLWS